MRFVEFIFLIFLPLSLYGQSKYNKNFEEGNIRVAVDILYQGRMVPLVKDIDFVFLGKMLIEPITRLEVTETGGVQTRIFKPEGFMIIDIPGGKYSKIDSLTCHAKLIKSGDLSTKSEGMLFNNELDLFEGQKVLVLPDSLVDGVSYKRFQTETTDPATKQPVRIIAHALSQKNNLPISLSATVENKYSCAIAFLDIYFTKIDRLARKSYTYMPYKLSTAEKQVLQCYKGK